MYHTNVCDILHSMTVDCKWNDWIIGECSKPCGGGISIDVRTKNISAAYGGARCPGKSYHIEENCNLQKCPGYRKCISSLFYNLNFVFDWTC